MKITIIRLMLSRIHCWICIEILNRITIFVKNFSQDMVKWIDRNCLNTSSDSDNEEYRSISR